MKTIYINKFFSIGPLLLEAQCSSVKNIFSRFRGPLFTVTPVSRLMTVSCSERGNDKKRPAAHWLFI